MSVLAETVPVAHPVTGSGGRLARHLLTRLLGAIGVLWAAATFTFVVQSLMPGNRGTMILNQQTGQNITRTAAELAPVNKEYGFDHSLLIQYLNYLGDLVRGNLGTSYQQHLSVLTIIRAQLWPTVALTVTSLVLAWLIAVLLTVGTVRRSRLVSGLGSAFETITAGLPQYWLGVVLLVVLAIQARIFPVQGGTSIEGLVLPALTLGLPLAGFLGQVTRDELDKVLDQPFILSARARGMGDLQIRLRHALRHAVLPAVSLSGWALGALFSGAVVVEAVFARPGLGNVLVAGADSRDIPAVSGVVMLVAFVYVIANVLVDAAYLLIDPRLRRS